MKRLLITFGALLLIGVAFLVNKINSDLNELEETFHHDHNLNDSTILILKERISPNAKYKFYEYQFDNGGFGYSRVFWSVVKNDDGNRELQDGILPDGYKANYWSNGDDLVVEKWVPYYYKSSEVPLNDGSEFNGVTIKLIE